MQPMQTSLICQENGSDKVYNAQLIPQDQGFVVNFQYGKRTGPLKAGTKTASPLPYAQAKKTYDKLVASKVAKGYTPDCTSATEFQAVTGSSKKSDFVAQLCNPIDEALAESLLFNSDWQSQEKMDGERRAIHAECDKVEGMNRKGIIVPLPKPLADEMREQAANTGTLRVDGELIGDVLYVFDLLIHCGDDIRESLSWEERMTLATHTFRNSPRIRPLPVAKSAQEKKDLWDRVLANRGEGIVFKKRDSRSTGGRPNSGGNWLKLKFTESASCIVLSSNPGKRSVSIGLYSNGELVPAGNVTIPVSYEIPESGKIVEVEYLYATAASILYQPVYRGVRTDIDPEACSRNQLKYKPGIGESEEDE